MKPFHTIAIPHKDILEGKYEMDMYAAKLGDVAKGRGLEEYRDSDTFFERTYETQGLKNIIETVENRVKKRGGDPIIQITTPFGGGKTHSLIALYHKAREWNVKTVVISGTDLSGDVPLWEIVEKDLTGKVEVLKGNVSPGKDKLRRVIEPNVPLLILMDEVAEYAEKAAAVAVVSSTMAAQAITFVQDLAELVGETEGACMVFTLPSSNLELAGPVAEEMRDKLQRVTGRVEKIYSPVQDHEIAMVIRKRLFSRVDESAVKSVVMSFVKYADENGILPEGVEATEYRDMFMQSYPFMPDVVDVLYKRWGSRPTFQRTRGVLRFLSLVIGSLKNSNKEYISLSDIDLNNREIRNELVKHIEPTFESVLAQDITGINSGSRIVDDSIGDAYQGLKIGTRSSTAIFMYSFTGGSEKGATSVEIKRSASVVGNPPSVVTDALNMLERKLFFLQKNNDRYYFDSIPNMNRLFLTKKENVKDGSVRDEEMHLLKKCFGGNALKIVPWPQRPEDVPDIEDLTLVVLRNADEDFMKKVLEKKGGTPRVNKNRLLFLAPTDSQRREFESKLRDKLAWEVIKKEAGSLNLDPSQASDVERRFKDSAQDAVEELFKAYNVVYLPDREGTQNTVVKYSMGIPTTGDNTPLDERVVSFLDRKGKVLKKLAPKVLMDKYLKDDYVSVANLYNSWMTVPGELRPLSRSVLENAVREGVRAKIFGFGYLVDGKPDCKYFGNAPTISFSDEEVVIRDSLCENASPVGGDTQTTLKPSESSFGGSETDKLSIDDGKKSESSSAVSSGDADVEYKEHVKLTMPIPKGRVYDVFKGIIMPLGKKFDDIEITIVAKEGKMSESEYSRTIEETLAQLGIKPKEESDGED